MIIHPARNILLVSCVGVLLAVLFLPAKTSAAGNIIANPSLEIQGGGGNPADWFRGKWGTNTALFEYPVVGRNDSRAARVALSDRTSGDAKWYFKEVLVSPGALYDFSDWYRSDIPNFVTVQFRRSDGSFTYLDIAFPASSSEWQKVSAKFKVPSGVTRLTIFHLIKQNGWIETDDFSLVEASAPTLDKEIVSLTFDDGWKTTYQNAIPLLNKAGFKNTNYVITGRFSFPAYINEEEALSLQNDGHEVASHSRTHRDLATLTNQEQESEIRGSRDDLFDIGIHEVNSFSYPFGSYTSSIQTITRQAGYITARATPNGTNDPGTTDLYALKRRSVEIQTTFQDVKGWIDEAHAAHTWLIIVFHRVDDSKTQYSITPAVFEEIVDYLLSSSVRVLTVTQALEIFPH